MRWNMAGLMAMALMCVVEVAGATPIVYTVNISDGTETLFGTITTDGALGAIAASDIIAWDLSASGTVSLSHFLQGSASCPVQGCNVSATATALVALGANGFLDLQEQPSGSRLVSFARGDVLVLDLLGTRILGLPLGYTIGTVGATAVPEPATAALLGIALACLGFACKRVRGRQYASS